MKKEVRNCVKSLDKNKDVEKMLPEYLKQSMEVHYRYAKVRLMMEYYIFYEMIEEGTNPYIETAKDTTKALNELLEEFLYSGEKQENLQEKWETTLKNLRQDVTEKMDVLTAYVDQFVVYEYVLNRLQYRFEKMEDMPSDAEFINDLVQYIFQSKDNVVVNDNIHSAIGQLPMRMTRSHYFDLIKNSLTVYKDSDKTSLNNYIYMFETNAMLYHTPKMESCFTEFVPVLQELASLDYDSLTAEGYKIYAEKIRVSASKLNDISDLYMLIQQLINEVYSMVLATPYLSHSDGEGEEDSQTMVLKGINALFLNKNSEVFENAQEELNTEEEKLYWLGNHFPEIEGVQEKLYESVNMVEAVFEETRQAQEKVIEKLNLKEEFHKLYELGMLSSNSVFVSMEENAEETKVTQKDVEEASAKLIAALKEKFIASNRMIRRAIMANTLEKIPVFFQTPQEVADYIATSLNQCEDEAEKYASKQLLQSLMND